MKKGLAALEGAAKVEEVSFKDGTGIYSVSVQDSAKVDPAAVKKAVGGFKLDRVDLKTTGEASKDDLGLWLTATSGSRLQLSNRPKKDEKDVPPDVLAKIAAAMKEGKTRFAVSGEIKEDKETVILQLESAEVVEKEKEKEKEKKQEGK